MNKRLTPKEIKGMKLEELEGKTRESLLRVLSEFKLTKKEIDLVKNIAVSAMELCKSRGLNFSKIPETDRVLYVNALKSFVGTVITLAGRGK